MRISILLLIGILAVLSFCQNNAKPLSEVDVLYTMPEESELHEGTWLQWPHKYQYGEEYSTPLDDTWVAMTEALVDSETVHIIAYNKTENNRIYDLLNTAGIAFSNIEFSIFPTDDVWIRDNGPIFVRDTNNQLLIEDWGFNGWGKDADYTNCDTIPAKIGAAQDRTVVDLNDIMVNEGGSIEIDGNGTLMACRSSILNRDRNRGMTQAEAEVIFKKYLGITHFIWLEGVAGLEITDMHIDGFARFANSTTIVTMSKNDLLEWDVPDDDIDTLYAAKNREGIAYTFVELPLTQQNVVTTYGENLGYKGSYVNFYIANTKVLVPNYNDANDSTANQLIQNLYPSRTVVGIDARNVFANGGMIHCVTQQQPEEIGY